MEKVLSLNQIKTNPLNPNKMGKQDLEKLSDLIKREGNYPPLVVNKHADGEYMLVDGHQRLQVLKDLGHEKIKCDVWEVDEETELILLATLNKLRGTAVGARKKNLYNKMAEFLTSEQIRKISPENSQFLDKTLKAPAPAAPPIPEIEGKRFLVLIQRMDREKYEVCMEYIMKNLPEEKREEALYWLIVGKKSAKMDENNATMH